MNKRDTDSVKKILKLLQKMYGVAECELHHENPLQLLVATILSAQCTDVRVNQVTPALFEKLKTAKDFASIPTVKLEEMIRSTGFFRSKAKSIQTAARQIEEQFGGKVPDTMDELTTLRGVGRKTANVLLGTAFGKNEGIVVDTHVGRLARRFRFSKNTDPEKVEKDLMKIVPRKNWTHFSHQMIWHGRRLCKARGPKCQECPIAPICPSSEV